MNASENNPENIKGEEEEPSDGQSLENIEGEKAEGNMGDKKVTHILLVSSVEGKVNEPESELEYL